MGCKHRRRHYFQARKLFRSISCPVQLNELSLEEEQINEVRNLIIKNKASGRHHWLDKDDLLQIINFMY